MTPNKEYLITQEQLYQIGHFREMFNLNAEYIQGLCSCEKDDVVIGFELGKMYGHIKQCYLDMIEFESKIKEQNNP